jgi:hypothetical protein
MLAQLASPSPAALTTCWPTAAVSSCADCPFYPSESLTYLKGTPTSCPSPRRPISASSQQSPPWPTPIFCSPPSRTFLTSRHSLCAGPVEGPRLRAALGVTDADLHPPESHRQLPPLGEQTVGCFLSSSSTCGTSLKPIQSCRYTGAPPLTSPPATIISLPVSHPLPAVVVHRCEVIQLLLPGACVAIHEASRL